MRWADLISAMLCGVFVAAIIGFALETSQRHRDAICARRFAAAHSASDSLAILRDTLDDCRPAFARALSTPPTEPRL